MTTHFNFAVHSDMTQNGMAAMVASALKAGCFCYASQKGLDAVAE